jgi:hypothetical protein
LERLRRQHKIALSLPPRRAQPPHLSVLEPGRRRAARRLTPAIVVLAVVAIGVAVLIALAL